LEHQVYKVSKGL